MGLGEIPENTRGETWVPLWIKQRDAFLFGVTILTLHSDSQSYM